MLKFLLPFIAIISFSNISMAYNQDFKEVLVTHKKMTVSDYEFFLEASIVQHEGPIEPGPVVAKMITDLIGIDKISFEPLYTYSDKEKMLLDTLFQGQYPPFFCNNFVDFKESDTVEKCRDLVKLLLPKTLLDKASRVSLLVIDGNYYGNWTEVSVIVDDYDSSESLIVRFDILHET